MIYKIFRQNEYDEFRENGASQGAPVDLQDGYIHFSTAAQLAGTLSKHFNAERPLYLLGVDESQLDNLKWEEARGGALFPHLYDVLKEAHVKRVWTLEDDELPGGLE